MSLFVLDPGLASRVVDLGRPRSRSLGVPVGGAADTASLTLGNGLVGNPPETPALEVTLKGPILRADAPLGCVLFGAPFDLSTARQALKTGRTFTLEPGEELHITGTPRGMRAYLCVRGGFQTPRILDSFSGLENVRSGMTLPCPPSRVHRRYLNESLAAGLGPARPESPKPAIVLRCLPGLQWDWFKGEEFFGPDFTASPAMNRMGARLQGKSLTLPAQELVSEPVSPGAVQVTRDGQCIILGVDGQTIGGYPKIAHVIQADLDLLGQLRPGAKVRFTPVNPTEARQAFLKKKDWLKQWSRRLLLSLDALR